MNLNNRLLINYLQGIYPDDPTRPDDKAVGIRHSDRHLALLAHLYELAGTSSPDVRRHLRESIVVEAERLPALVGLTDELAREGIPSLILKGAALSYTVYPAPHLRPRNDDDLWVRAADFAKACRVLEAEGYAPQIEVTSRDITRQRHFHSERRSLPHQVDLHWWPVNPAAFDTLPGFDDCLAASVPLPAVGPNARAPGPVHALLLACAHRVAHHTSTEDAMWLCDLHLLASRLTSAEWAAVELHARAARVAQVTGTELARAREALGTPVPERLIERLLVVDGEPSARHLRPLGPLRDLWLALVAQPSARDRARLLRHHLLPPRRYIAARYGYDGRAALPFLYTYRAVNGLARWTAQLIARRTRH